MGISVLKPEQQKYPISESVLVARINRALACKVVKVKRRRSKLESVAIGRYVGMTIYNWRVDNNVNIERLGRELGVLRDHERLSKEG